MKKAIVVLSVLFLVSCEKAGMRDHDDDDDAKKCECVSNESVPATVQTAFKNKYTQNTAEKWFNKDNKGFTALFTQNGTKTLAQFDNDGTFRTENVVPPQNPPSAGPGGQCPQHHGNCQGHHRKGPHPLFGMHKHHGNCHHDHPEKQTECHVAID
jgi:hypothetical protein